MAEGREGTSLASPLVTLYACVRGATFERYAEAMWRSAAANFLPGECEYVQLPARQGWPQASACRYSVAVEHASWLRGDYIFQIDADTRVEGSVGREILADGLTVTTHPGYPPTTPPDSWPYERRPESTAYVPLGSGTQYHPGAFVGGKRDAFLTMAARVGELVEQDHRNGTHAVWYEESHLNRYLIDNPPALVLDERYCYWDAWGPDVERRKIVHLDKTPAEFAARNAG